MLPLSFLSLTVGRGLQMQRPVGRPCTILGAESVHHTRKDYLKQIQIKCLLDVR